MNFFRNFKTVIDKFSIYVWNCSQSWMKHQQQQQQVVMKRYGQMPSYDDCIDSRLLMVASLSPRLASSTDLITSTSTSGNMSLTTATSSSVTGLAAAGWGWGGWVALAGTAEPFKHTAIFETRDYTVSLHSVVRSQLTTVAAPDKFHCWGTTGAL